MINIAIVEDEDQYVETLKSYLLRYETEHGEHFKIQVFSDGLDIISDYTPDYDIILLDIQMKHLNGMKTAEKIREFDEEVTFIFITSSTQFALEGYLVDALGYVLKPVPYLSFSQLLKKAVLKINKKKETHYITVDVDGGTMRVNLDSVSYIESQLHQLLIHTEKGSYVVPGPMKRMEETLKPFGFSKCHHAYLVNLNHVTGILNNHVLLLSTQQIPLSRTRKKLFMDCLTDYLGG
jgi:DNA-binding LytR/AlgR family response regulator